MEDFKTIYKSTVTYTPTDDVVADKVTEDNETTYNEPAYYTKLGFNCIDLINHFDLDFYDGNFFKYIYRAGLKHDSESPDKKQSELDDLIKARYYYNTKDTTTHTGFCRDIESCNWLCAISEVKDYFKRVIMTYFVVDLICGIDVDDQLMDMLNARIESLQNAIAKGETEETDSEDRIITWY